MALHGKPCWFELTTAKGTLDKATDFYGKLFDWTMQDAGMAGFTYLLASDAGDMVAGLMEMPDDLADTQPFWMVYFEVVDTDATASRIRELGGRIHSGPADIPDTGRFAIAVDPQGASFGILQPLPMDPSLPEKVGAWNQQKEGRGNWVELMSTDPGAGFSFYADLFGWQKSTPVDMGGMGTYQVFSHEGVDIGGIMGLGDAPISKWLPYFGVRNVGGAIKRIEGAGGLVLYGPTEVPGGAVIAVARDPQTVHFAIVGPTVGP